MSVFHALVLGIVQGLTEFLPISSSAHLFLFPTVFGWDVQSVFFDVALHVATLGAVLVAFWRDITLLVRGVLLRERAALRMAGFLLVGTIPAGIAGVFFGDIFAAQRTVFVIAFMLIAWGVLLFVADVVATRLPRVVRSDARITFPLAFALGLVQACALIPGTSRSGATMSVGLLLGMDRSTAARFSFLLAIPAILGAGLVTSFDAVAVSEQIAILPLVVGCLSAFFSGLFAIRFLLAVIEKGGFRYFAAYRIVLGICILLFLV